MGGWVAGDGWMGGWVDGWMGGWVGGWVNSPLSLLASVPPSLSLTPHSPQLTPCHFLIGSASPPHSSHNALDIPYPTPFYLFPSLSPPFPPPSLPPLSGLPPRPLTPSHTALCLVAPATNCRSLHPAGRH